MLRHKCIKSQWVADRSVESRVFERRPCRARQRVGWVNPNMGRKTNKCSSLWTRGVKYWRRKRAVSESQRQGSGVGSICRCCQLSTLALGGRASSSRHYSHRIALTAADPGSPSFQTPIDRNETEPDLTCFKAFTSNTPWSRRSCTVVLEQGTLSIRLDSDGCRWCV